MQKAELLLLFEHHLKQCLSVLRTRRATVENKMFAIKANIDSMAMIVSEENKNSDKAEEIEFVEAETESPEPKNVRITDDK